jgi:hypothetical protein
MHDISVPLFKLLLNKQNQGKQLCLLTKTSKVCVAGDQQGKAKYHLRKYIVKIMVHAEPSMLLLCVFP